MTVLTQIGKDVDYVEMCPCVCGQCGAITMLTQFDYENIDYCPHCGSKINKKVAE